MEEPARSRRSAIRSLILSLLGAVGLWRFLTPRGLGSATGKVVSVPEPDVPAGGALVLPQHQCAIVRQGADFLALDLTCTHLACTVGATTEGFVCPCHGSRFSSGGQPLGGPATRPLKRLALEQRDGTILVFRG